MLLDYFRFLTSSCSVLIFHYWSRYFTSHIFDQKCKSAKATFKARFFKICPGLILLLATDYLLWSLMTPSCQIWPHIMGHYIVIWHIFDKSYIRWAWNQLSKMAHYYLYFIGLEVEIYKTSNMLIMTFVSSRCEIFQKSLWFSIRKFSNKIYSGKPNSSTAI